MAFRFGDPGGRIYGNTAKILPWWDTVINGSGGNTVVIPDGGRFVGSCLRHNAISTQYLTKNFNNQATFGVSMAVKFPVLPFNWSFISFFDTTACQCDLYAKPDASLMVTRNGALISSTPANTLMANIWQHIELKITFHLTAGIVYLAVDGVQKLNLTNQNTSWNGNSYANVVHIGPLNGNAQTAIMDMDDIIIYDGQLTDANGFADITGPIGNCRLDWLLPNGPGTLTQWTSNGESNYSSINSPTLDETTYAIGSEVGNIDTYNIQDLVSVPSVKSVAVVNYSRKGSALPQSMKTILCSAGVNAIHPTLIVPNDNFGYYFSAFGQNPNNGVPIAWTPAAVNTLEIGQVITT